MKPRHNKDGSLTLGVIKDGENLSESERKHIACYRARLFYFTTTGVDLPIERFEAVKDHDGDYIVTIKEANNER